MAEWIAVSERLPETEESVLVVANGYHWIARYYKDGTGWVGHYENSYWDHPTHWMPLPAIPDGIEEGEG